uniref:Maturin n=1 Tax=Phasianus colchicus TaxID=9054 RepID=A0A669PT57_PHACC
MDTKRCILPGFGRVVCAQSYQHHGVIWGFLLGACLLGQRQRDGVPLCASHSESPKPCSPAQRGATGPGQAPRGAPQAAGADGDGVSRQTSRRHGTDGAPRPVLLPTGAARTARLGAPRVLPTAPHPGSAPARQKRARSAGSGGRRAPRNPLPRSPPGGGQARPTARRLPPPPSPRATPAPRRGGGGRGARSAAAAAMAFEALAEAAERWCARTPFQLIAAEETERRMDFYAEPGVSFYVLCPEAACGDNFVSDRGWGGGRGEEGSVRAVPGGLRPRGRVRGAAGRGSPPCERRKLQDGVVGRCGAGRARTAPPPPLGPRGRGARRPPANTAPQPPLLPKLPPCRPASAGGSRGRVANGEWAGIKWSRDDSRAVPAAPRAGAAPPAGPRRVGRRVVVPGCPIAAPVPRGESLLVAEGVPRP